MTVIVCGGGAAGMIAAGTAAKSADKVILIEKNDVLGKKLRITGKGRCNITNACDIEDMIGMYPVNGKFLYSALYTFTNDDIVELIESYGVKTKVERGGRVFPESDDARDVVSAMRKYALQPNVKLLKDEVKSLIIEDGKIKGVKTSGGIYKADSVIMCNGGASYPQTGSDGSGYRMAEKAGHTVITPTPSLVPLCTEEKWCADIMGLSLKNVEVTAFNSGNKKIYSGFGEMLFTHFGVSGPLILSLSAHIKKELRNGVTIRIDLKPALSNEQLDSRILRDFQQQKNKHIINALDGLLPKKLIPVVIDLSDIEPHKAVCEITREERKRLVDVFKGLTLAITGFRPLREAIITSGGIKTSEINSSTMESKLVPGLYFAGEIIDVDGYTGGYNLQVAWSTGYLAGMNASVNK